MFTILLIISLGVFTLISIYNLFTAPVIKSFTKQVTEKKLVSVLIPARNEEKNIVRCIECALAQDYKNIEIIILDDNSSDKTYELAASFNLPRLKVIKGKELPSDWLGKNWACHQLANQANGEYLLFLDADVDIKYNVISSAVNELEESNVSLLSVFPTQVIKSFGEHLIVPLMNWLLLTFLPLKFVYSTVYLSFVAANGQFMLWKKEDYLKIGGHNIVKNKVVEDMELARAVKHNGLKVKTKLGGELIYCRMYNSFSQSYSGFLKNFYAGFSVHPIQFIIIISFLLIVFTAPILALTNVYDSFIPLVLVFTSRTAVSLKSKQNWLINNLLHPFQILLMFWIGIISLIKYKTNKLVWKQRNL
ncbi:MAG: glycosyltransferase [Ignavibacterium sp.]|jgi:chlorobactene glucosyltransferase|nr:glycosyltransferase [Ignavibacterium sp.]